MSPFTEDVPVHDTALTADAPAFTTTLDPAAPTTPAARLDNIAAIFADGIRRRRRKVAISVPSHAPHQGPPPRPEPSAHDTPDGPRG